ncbi:MAG: mechanosensitive ion channel family protein, partial [Phycisphaerae bacterium]
GWLACAILGIAGSFGVNVNTFAAIIGSAGLAIGLAFQGTLSNIASGVLLLVFRPFKVGDSVVIAGVAGVVNEIDLFTTALDTADGRRVIVPNAQIAGAVIDNQSHHPRRRFEVLLSVQFDADPNV